MRPLFLFFLFVPFASFGQCLNCASSDFTVYYQASISPSGLYFQYDVYIVANVPGLEIVTYQSSIQWDSLISPITQIYHTSPPVWGGIDIVGWGGFFGPNHGYITGYYEGLTDYIYTSWTIYDVFGPFWPSIQPIPGVPLEMFTLGFDLVYPVSNDALSMNNVCELFNPMSGQCNEHDPNLINNWGIEVNGVSLVTGCYNSVCGSPFVFLEIEEDEEPEPEPEEQTKIYSSNSNIVFLGLKGWRAEVFDYAGRLAASFIVDHTHRMFICSGVYIVRVTKGSRYKIEKLMF